MGWGLGVGVGGWGLGLGLGVGLLLGVQGELQATRLLDAHDERRRGGE